MLAQGGRERSSTIKLHPSTANNTAIAVKRFISPSQLGVSRAALSRPAMLLDLASERTTGFAQGKEKIYEALEKHGPT
ncbi:hypothetical protein LTR46_011222, partial [Exophiala xenobiotica]